VLHVERQQDRLQTKTKDGSEDYLWTSAWRSPSVPARSLVANETVLGARDDATHVEVMRYTLTELTKRSIGYTVHALHRSLVADLHRDDWGPVAGPPPAGHSARGTRVRTQVSSCALRRCPNTRAHPCTPPGIEAAGAIHRGRGAGSTAVVMATE
jgi:hypothetical protein